MEWSTGIHNDEIKKTSDSYFIILVHKYQISIYKKVHSTSAEIKLMTARTRRKI